MRERELRRVLSDACGRVEVLSDRARRSARRRWQKTYSRNVKAFAGRWCFYGLDWHTFSWGFASARSGSAALTLYRAQGADQLIVLPEDVDLAAFRRLEGGHPDLSNHSIDVSISPEDFRWTVVFTHDDDCGPYFARASWQRSKSSPPRHLPAGVLTKAPSRRA